MSISKTAGDQSDMTVCYDSPWDKHQRSVIALNNLNRDMHNKCIGDHVQPTQPSSSLNALTRLSPASHVVVPCCPNQRCNSCENASAAKRGVFYVKMNEILQNQNSFNDHAKYIGDDRLSFVENAKKYSKMVVKRTVTFEENQNIDRALLRDKGNCDCNNTEAENLSIPLNNHSPVPELYDPPWDVINKHSPEDTQVHSTTECLPSMLESDMPVPTQKDLFCETNVHLQNLNVNAEDMTDYEPPWGEGDYLKHSSDFNQQSSLSSISRCTHSDPIDYSGHKTDFSHVLDNHFPKCLIDCKNDGSVDLKLSCEQSQEEQNRDFSDDKSNDLSSSVNLRSGKPSSLIYPKRRPVSDVIRSPERHTSSLESPVQTDTFKNEFQRCPIVAQVEPTQSRGSDFNNDSWKIRSSPDFSVDPDHKPLISASISKGETKFPLWWHGSITRRDAEEILLQPDSLPGNFLVRTSKSGDYSLSLLNSDNQVIHVIITERTDSTGNDITMPRNYYLGMSSKSFRSISSIISYYTHHPLPVKGAKHHVCLRDPATLDKKCQRMTKDSLNRRKI